MGLTPGATLEFVGEREDYLSLEVEGETMRLAPSAAEHVHVSPAPARPVALGELSPGSRAHVVETRGTGRHQRRLLDMGLVPGAEVSVLRSAPLGDPVEYRVKGAAISMRRSDANTVLVEEEGSGDDD
jgi:ferrous iron transport protein A